MGVAQQSCVEDPATETENPAGETADPATETADPAGQTGGPARETADRVRETTGLIRILLGQNGTLFRGALASVLSFEDLQVVAEVGVADAVLEAAARARPDVAVLDVDLPGSIALGEVCRRLVAQLPECGVLVMLDRQLTGVGRALARLVPRVGLLATDATTGDLVAGVRRLAHGEPVLDVELAVAALTARTSPLTPREGELLRLVGDGASAKEIAKTLFLSPGTVRNYLARIVAKTGARNRIEAVRIAQDAGWI